MIQEFVDRYIAAQDGLFRDKHPGSYLDVVRTVIETISGTDPDPYDSPDPTRIHEIDDGHYQGTLVYVIAEGGYQPSDYWIVPVSYGSCSGCDTLQSICGYEDGQPSEQQAKDYQTLGLHIVQQLKQVIRYGDVVA